MITLTDDEKRIVFQLEGCHRYDAIQEIAVFCQYTRDHDKRATAIGRYAITIDIKSAAASNVKVRRDFIIRFTSNRNNRILISLPFQIFLRKIPKIQVLKPG